MRVPDIGEEVGVSGVIDGADDAVAAAAAAAAVVGRRRRGVAVGRRRLRLLLAVGVAEAEQPAVPRDLLRVGDPVEQVADVEHRLLGHGHHLVLEEGGGNSGGLVSE